MMPTQKTVSGAPVSIAEAQSLFADLVTAPALILAVSGGPDSTALMVLAAHWRQSRKKAPELIAVTVDHGLRPESKAEAAGVARLARKLKIAHRTLRWTGKKPKAGLPQAARVARYRLLAHAARKAGASHVLTAHTLDDQAETVMIRMMRGSGVTGLAAMRRISALPGHDGILLVRPLLDIAKARLIDTLRAQKIAFADDPTNRDAKFTRARLRSLMPRLAQEGLDARRLSLLAQRLRRADEAIEAAVNRAATELKLPAASGAFIFNAVGFARRPAEIALRLLGRAIAEMGDEGPVELGKLEALTDALAAAQNTGSGFRRSLAGAVVTLAKGLKGQITVERAPPRRAGVAKAGIKFLTKRRPGSAGKPKRR
jgi:tRNA(Ile)-lysidine synthase